MIKMLNNEARKLLVEGYEATHNAKEIAKIFHVNKYTVYHLEELKRKTGSVELQTWRRGRKALLNSEDKARIAQCITNNPTISLEELRTQLECVSKMEIRKFEWILCQFKEETRRLSSAKSSLVTQKWRIKEFLRHTLNKALI